MRSFLYIEKRDPVMKETDNVRLALYLLTVFLSKQLKMDPGQSPS